MSDEPVPLCDKHLTQMWPEKLSFPVSAIYGCAVQDCRRYYGPRLGYFYLFPQTPEATSHIDAANRCMKVCPQKAQEHAYMAITRRVESYGWYCYNCCMVYEPYSSK